MVVIDRDRTRVTFSYADTYEYSLLSEIRVEAVAVVKGQLNIIEAFTETLAAVNC